MTNESFYLLASPTFRIQCCCIKTHPRRHPPAPQSVVDAGWAGSCPPIQLPSPLALAIIYQEPRTTKPNASAPHSLTKHDKVVNLKSSPATDRPRAPKDIVLCCGGKGTQQLSSQQSVTAAAAGKVIRSQYSSVSATVGGDGKVGEELIACTSTVVVAGDPCVWVHGCGFVELNV